MNARLTCLLRWLLLAVLVCLNAGCARLAIPADDVPLRAVDGYFPGAAWRTSPPEAQGIDSEALVALMDAVEAEHLPIHSLHVMRYGHLVLDAYFHPFLQGERHDVASVTKSVTTTLVGLALERGAIAGLDAPVYPLLSPAPAADARKQQIRLRHLLTTSSGLDCGLAPYERETLAMAASADWVRFALDLPMAGKSGTPAFRVASPGDVENFDTRHREAERLARRRRRPQRPVAVIAGVHWSAIRIRDPFETESFAAVGGRDVQ